MSAQIIQFVPKPNPKRLTLLEQEASKIMSQVWEAGAGPGILNGVKMSDESEAVWYGGSGIDGMPYPDKDPA